MNLLTAINNFIFEDSLQNNPVPEEEFMLVKFHLNAGKKVEAIKTLRNATRRTSYVGYEQQAGNTFSQYLSDRQIEFSKEVVIGLKKAKDVIDFMLENRDLW